jgi:hypothetical protein
MGCGSSIDDVQLERLRRELHDSKLRASEQQNLLRFKIEVLVNMLAAEEKKSEADTKRIETLKWLLYKEGVATEDKLTSLLIKADGAETDTDRDNLLTSSLERGKSFRNIELVDISGALSRVREEFELYKTDIIPAFAGEDGKVVVSLSVNDFMKQLYVVTEKLSKADIQVIYTVTPLLPLCY